MTILILEKLNLIYIFMINLGHEENRRCDMHQIRRENAESASGLGFIDHFSSIFYHTLDSLISTNMNLNPK